MENISELRKPYTKDTYSPKLTKELLFELYKFLTSKQVEKLKYFSEYDKASLLCAIEIIDQQQKDIDFFLKKKKVDNKITQELAALNDDRVIEILTRTRVIE
jgi:predicted house-cleaning noncanonical NTP pyrophosphatase (MazG superfamily)